MDNQDDQTAFDAYDLAVRVALERIATEAAAAEITIRLARITLRNKISGYYPDEPQSVAVQTAMAAWKEVAAEARAEARARTPNEKILDELRQIK